MNKLMKGLGSLVLGAYLISVGAMDFYYSWLWIKESPVAFISWSIYGWMWTTLKAVFWPIVEFLL